MGRPINVLLEIFNKQCKISDYLTINRDLFSTKLDGLTLMEYCKVRKYMHECILTHNRNMCDCEAILHIAEMVMNDCIVPVSKAFRIAFPQVTYHQKNAKRRLLQMPVIILRIQGTLFLMEKKDVFDYTGLAKYLNIAEPHNVKGITKEEVKRLMLLTQSDRERELVRYIVHKASGGTQKKTATRFGFRKMEEHSAHVEACISTAAEICSSISELSILQNQAMLEYHCGSMQTQPNCSTEDEGASVNICDASSKPTDIVGNSTIVTDEKSIENNSAESAAVQNCMPNKSCMLLASSDSIVMKKCAAIKDRARRLKVKRWLQRDHCAEKYRKELVKLCWIVLILVQ